MRRPRSFLRIFFLRIFALVSGVASAGASGAGCSSSSSAPSSPSANAPPADGAAPPVALASSSVQLVDVDPAPPEHGTRRMIEAFWQAADGVYWQKDTLAVRPALGYPLRPATRYALVVTGAVRGGDGRAVAASSDLREV